MRALAKPPTYSKAQSDAIGAWSSAWIGFMPTSQDGQNEAPYLRWSSRCICCFGQIQDDVEGGVARDQTVQQGFSGAEWHLHICIA